MGRWAKRTGPAALARFGLRVGLAALLGATFLGTGCASERAPIGRVQPYALSKSFFLGENLNDAADDPEFRFRTYVVDGSASQSALGVGSWGHVDRIKWEITEDMLIARKAYAIAEGQDLKGVNGLPGKKINDGTMVGAWKIESHFDIRRGYNTVTGEELNVVEENSQDRPWNAREYIRVDWSKNLVTNNPMWDEFFRGSVFGGFNVTPIQYTVTDPNDDNAIHFDTENGYFDLTTKYYVEPDKASLWGMEIPQCLVYGLFTGSGTYECDAQEAVVRFSFAKVPADEDFEPLENTWANQDVLGNPGGAGDSFSVGVVTAPRQQYDPQYGYTDKGMHRYANVHNIWKQSHQKKADGSWVTCDDNTDSNLDGTADQCANDVTGYSGSKGSQCDMAMKKCTLPYRDREIKTISYWVNKDAPGSVLDVLDANGNVTERGTLEDLTYSWNQLMRNAPAFAKEVECRKTGDGNRDACHANFFSSTSDPKTKEMVSYGNWLVDVPKDPPKGPKTVLTFCHNPVRAYDDHEACGETGATARVGDVRKNFIFFWPYESRAPWGGIANWEGDPLTGQAFGNAAQIMGRSATYAAAMQRDIIQLALGDIKLDDIIENTPADTYLKHLEDGRSPGLTVDEIKARRASIDVAHLRTTLGAKPLTGTPDEKLTTYLNAVAKSTNSIKLASTATLESDAYMKKLRDTPVEAQMVDSHWMVNALGTKDPGSLGSNALNAASPLRAMDPGKMQVMFRLMQEALQARGACFFENEAPVTGSVYMPGVAGYFKAKYGSLSAKERGQKIYEDLFKESVKGIALHEIGHSLGMFHNFASSWDATNYNPQYWQLRTGEGAASKSCAGAPRTTGDTDSCMGPRYLDPETKDEAGLAGESRPGIDYFSNTSTMEYQIERFGETVGLGAYDYHTMNALYGRVVSTFDDKIHTLTAQKTFKYTLFTQLQEKLIIPTSSGSFKHYTEAARLMKVFDPARDCRPATEEEKKAGGWRVVHGKVCATEPKDVWSWSDFKTDALQPGLNGILWHTTDKVAGEKKDRLRWQYRFGQSHNAYFHANDSDAGADAYEAALNTGKRFHDTYPWAYFRRKNREYYYQGIPSRTIDRYIDRVRSYHWQIALDLSRSGDVGLDDDDDLRPYVMAEGEMMKLLQSAVLAPEPGDYATSAVRTPVDSVKQIFDVPDSGSGEFTIGVPDGRYIAEDFNNDLGGSWDYLSFMNHASFDVEKSMALLALVDGRPTLFTISRDNWLDGRDVKINFRNDQPQFVDRLIGGLLSEDWETVAPHVNGDKNPTPAFLDLGAAAPTRPAGSKVLFPNIGYKQQVAAGVWTAIFSALSADETLINKSKIWVDGASDAISLPSGQAIKFYNPGSGKTYVARKYGADNIDGKVVDKGIASRVMAHANNMLAAAYEVTMVAGKPKLDEFDMPELVLDPVTKQPKVVNTDAETQYLRYVQLVDTLRNVSRITFGADYRDSE